MKALATLAAMAAALVASESDAADLARKAPGAVDYVKVCDTHGAGFFYIPGSDTCLKIGGYVRAFAYAGGGDDGDYGSGRDRDRIGTMTRFDLEIDARSQTEFGLLRSIAEIRFNLSSSSTSVETETEIEQGYLQWGGLTAGRAQSFFDFFTGTTIEEVYGEAGLADAKTNLIAYTFELAEGLTSTVSIEDTTTSGRRSFDGEYYGGLKSPDLVANVNLTRDWGSAQVMGALHENNSQISGWGSKLGWALGAGVQINLPMLGSEDMIGIQVAYARGAAGYTSLDEYLFDFYELPDWQSRTLAVTVGYTHTFNDAWSAAAQVSYANLRSDLESVSDYALNIASVDYSASVTWAPVEGLTFDIGAEYRHREIFGIYGSTISNKTDDWVLVGRVSRAF